MRGPANWKQWAYFGLAGAGIILGAGAAYLHWDSPLSRAWVVHHLEQRYHVQVQVSHFHSSLFPRIQIEGTGLILRRPADAGLPPLVEIASFHAEARWERLLWGARHVGHVQLDGLVLNIPPHHGRADGASSSAKNALILNSVDSTNAILNLLSAQPGTPPRVLAISSLHMQAEPGNNGMGFQAELTNPKPIGHIQTSGRFGPWDADDPGSTPVAGQYQFSHADLSTINGLAGILSSRGTMQGPLSELRVHGTTATPDFALGDAGHAIPLRTQFTAVVDGTSGDTNLQPVIAYLGQSKITARGEVVGSDHPQGKVIHLTVAAGTTAAPAHLEDLLGLAVKSDQPPMLGAVTTQAQLDISPGPAPVIQRMRLAGKFRIHDAHFTDPGVQAQMVRLSRRGQGQHDPAPAPGAAPPTTFAMGGDFRMAAGRVHMAHLVLALPGAVVRLSGTYTLASQAIDFHGTVAMPAKLSQMTTGWKSLLLRALDPLVEHGTGGTVLPISITGHRAHPVFKVDLGKLLRGHS